MANQISDVRKRYPPPSKCIYCGASDKPLFDEHIIPYALAGDAVIFENASCKDCADEFNREFETEVLKHSFEIFRFKIDAPSRSIRKRRKKRRISFPVEFGPHHAEPRTIITDSVELDKHAHPGGMFVLLLRQPKIFSGIAASPNDTVDAWSNYNLEKLKLIVGEGPVRVHVGPINPLHFARFIAKIGFSYAVAEWGENSFVPIILPLVRGEVDLFTDLVGGDYEIPPPNKHIHELSHYVVENSYGKFLCVRIRLFCFAGSPVYHIVVGLNPP